MKKYSTTKLCSLFSLLLAALLSSSQSSANPDEPFDYSQSVALILKADDGGGYIFQRPERYDPANTFVTSFAIVHKYTSHMEPAHSNLELDIGSLQPQDSFLLVNHQNTKLLYLGDHWLGDENTFAVMEAADYQNLKRIFDLRRQVSKPTQEEAQKAYIKEIHDLWQEDSEEFYRRYYFPGRESVTVTDNSSTLSHHSAPAQSTEPMDSNFSSAPEEETLTNSSPTNLPVPTDSIDGETNHQRLVFWLCILPIVIAVFWWWRKRR